MFIVFKGLSFFFQGQIIGVCYAASPLSESKLQWLCFDGNLSAIHMQENMLYIWKAVKFLLNKFTSSFVSAQGHNAKRISL